MATHQYVYIPLHISIFLTILLFICDYLIIFAMLKMTMHCDHTIFRRFSNFQFSLVPTLATPMAITKFSMQ